MPKTIQMRFSSSKQINSKFDSLYLLGDFNGAIAPNRSVDYFPFAIELRYWCFGHFAGITSKQKDKRKK